MGARSARMRHADMLDEITRDETTRSKPQARTHERARSADTGDRRRAQRWIRLPGCGVL